MTRNMALTAAALLNGHHALSSPDRGKITAETDEAMRWPTLTLSRNGAAIWSSEPLPLVPNRAVGNPHRHPGAISWLFGGWAAELPGLAPPCPHHDLDLLHPARDFAAVDALLAASQDLTEIPAKHLPHKRAFLRLGIMTELTPR